MGSRRLLALVSSVLTGAATLFGPVPSAGAAAACGAYTVTVDLSVGDVPTEGDDVVLGTAGDDTIDALGGDDVVCGEGGRDSIQLGEGNDIADGGPGDDVIDGGRGNDYVHGGDGADSVRGGDGNDIVLGAAGDDTVVGDDGADYLFGGTGIDRYLGDTYENSVADPALAADWLAGGDEGELMEGGPGNDVILAGGGDDTVDGGAGVDYLQGDSGANLLRGGDDFDWIQGGTGAERLLGDAGDDILLGGAGDDWLHGGTGSDYLNGQDGANHLHGNDDRDYLDGGPGGETLYGGAGNDIVLGGGGTDTASGGPGSDYVNGGTGDADRCLASVGEDYAEPATCDAVVPDVAEPPVVLFRSDHHPYSCVDQLWGSGAIAESVGGPIDTYDWSFSGEYPAYTYEQDPPSRITIVVCNAGTTGIHVTATGPGGSTTASISLETLILAVPFIDQISGPSAAVVGETAVFLPNVFCAFGGCYPFDWVWSLGDGQTYSGTARFGADDPPLYARWNEPGTYTVTLTVSNPRGSFSTSVEVVVTGRAN